MTEFVQFLKFLYSKKLILILVPLVTTIASYFLVKRLPDQYKSEARISTGLVDKTDQGFSLRTNEQQSEISQKFNNIIQSMLLKKTLDPIGYQLILHDLKAKSAEESYRKPSSLLKDLSPQQRSRAIAVFSQKLATKEELSPQKKEDLELQELLESMKYDNESLTKKFNVYRIGDSDYIKVEFEGENPYLTEFAVNALCNEFITSFSNRLQSSNTRSIEFLEAFMNEKMSNLSRRMNELKNFKIQNRVLNLNEQARNLYGEITDFETKKEVAVKDVVAYSAALKNIDSKFNPADRRYLEDAMTAVNQKVIAVKQQLRAANDVYYSSNFDPKFKRRVDSLQTQLSEQISAATDTYVYNPLVAKGDLVTQKLSLEIQREIAQNSIKSLQDQLDKLNRRLDTMVPNEARVQEYETSIDVASKEYIEALQRYNEAKMLSQYMLQLRVLEKALPGAAAPSKKIILVALSGIVSFVLCVFVFFIIYYLDKSIRDPLSLANATNSPVLGRLNVLNDPASLNQSWQNQSDNKNVQQYKDLLRSVRFELDNELKDKHILAITSLTQGEGKTLITLSLSQAFSMIGKKVLVIDGNFLNPAISQSSGSSLFLEDYLTGKVAVPVATGSHSIQFLSNKGLDYSLLEIASEAAVQQKMEELRRNFDVILIETASLESLNKAKEWIAVSDKVVAVYKSGETITPKKAPAVTYLTSLKNSFTGWILNKTTIA